MTEILSNAPGEQAGMGRMVAKDERDHAHLMVARPEAAAIRHKYWTSYGVLDQGDTPMCVGYSAHKWLTSYPVRNDPPFQPDALYKMAQQNDEWPGEDYEGSSVRGAFKALKARGYVSDYSWAFDIEPVISHLLLKGPVVVGTLWTAGMCMIDKHGCIDDPGGEVVGGHAYLLIGANRDKVTEHGKGAVRILNSWGPNWGQTGRAWLSFGSLDALLKNDGEACTATEIKKVG